MKNKFRHYIRPTEDEFNSLWDEATFVFDTNVLKKIYEYSPKTRKEFLATIKKLESRVWLPYQIAQEFFKIRPHIIRQQKSEHEAIHENLESCKNQVLGVLPKHHPLEDDSEWKAAVASAFEPLYAKLNTSAKQYPDYFADDSLLDELFEIFDKKVGDPYPKKRLDEIRSEGDARYKEKIPPGFSDKGKPQGKFGDLILWLQIIDYAKEKKTPIVFVTDDQKEDWWLIDKNSNILSPLPELRQEFFENTGSEFYMYNSLRFSKYARQYISAQISERSMKELGEVMRKAAQSASEVTSAIAKAMGPSLSATFKSLEQQNREIRIILDDVFKGVLHSDLSASAKDRLYPSLYVDPEERQEILRRILNINSTDSTSETDKVQDDSREEGTANAEDDSSEDEDEVGKNGE